MISLIGTKFDNLRQLGPTNRNIDNSKLNSSEFKSRNQSGSKYDDIIGFRLKNDFNQSQISIDFDQF